MDNIFKNPIEKKRKKNDLPKPNLDINPESEEVFFADPVHSLIGFSEKCMQIIDTPQYNRLRDLKQLGLTYLVFPSATHTRFEHSLGVGYLAGSLAKKIKKKQPYLEISDQDVELVKIAGLCHDLGHGPFSHAFETWVHRKDPSFKHEEMSQKIFEDLVNENAIDLENKDINFIKDLIMGNRPTQKSFLSEIVSNSKCSLDVDKLDYLIRDSYHIGFSQKNQYLYQRLFANCRVLNSELCYHSKVSYDIYQVFSQRYDMFKRVYCHRVSLAIECMVSDVFDLSDPFLQISNRIYDSKEYTNLTDGIFNTIQISKDKELEKARDLIKRIQKRQLYKYVEQLILTPKEFNTIKDKIKPEKLIEFKPKGSNLTPDDFVVKVQTMNFAFGEKNPMDNIRFYNKYEKETPFKLQENEISNLLPSNFAEKYVTLFCKKNDKTLLEDIQHTLRTFTTVNEITSPGKKDFISPNHPPNVSRIN